MTLATAVADYVKARTEADAAPVWSRLMQEGIVCARMQELLAACYADNETLADALIDHAPDYVRAQAERWRGMADLLEPVKEPEPIVVLGPWQQRSTGAWLRQHIGSDRYGVYVFEGEYQLRDKGAVQLHCSEGDKDDADREARERGWVLLDAEPLSEPVTLGPWQIGPEGERLAMAAALALGFVEGT